MKRLYKIFASWFLCLFLVLSQFIVSFADVNSLMIRTSSNALMTMELNDDDYGISLFSSLGSIVNTVDGEGVLVSVGYTDRSSGNTYWANIPCVLQNGRYSFRFDALDGFYISRVYYRLTDNSFPPSGVFRLQFDFGSNLSFDYNNTYIYSRRLIDNSQFIEQLDDISSYVATSSGDLFVGPVNIEFGNVDWFDLRTFPRGTGLSSVSGSFAWRFEKVSESANFSTVGLDMNDSDYQDGVSSSLSDLSSSVDTMTDEISGVTEAIQNLQGAMEPHYSNVLTQLHHITEQLHAFYDQVYNNIHLQEKLLLTQIRNAIENIDLQIEVDISEVKTAINNMSTAVQNKLQSTTDQITGGYDNSGIVSDQTELDSALNEYQQAEDELFEDAKEHINNFEFDTPLDQYVKPLEDISYFLTGIFNGLGGLNIPIQFSLTLTIALILIGYYRIKR